MADREEPLRPCALTKIRKIILVATPALAILAAFFQAKEARNARAEAQKLFTLQEQSAKQISDLQSLLRDESNQLADQLAENSRLKNNSDKTELLKLRGEVTRLRPLQDDVVALQKMLRQSSAGLPAWKTNEIANAGRATLLDALQTFIYSSLTTNTADLQQGIVGDDVNPPSPDAVQNFINDSNNHSLGNDGITGYRILSENWLASDKVQVEFGVSLADGMGMSVPFTLRNVNGEWKLVVFNVPDPDGKASHVDFFNKSPNP